MPCRSPGRSGQGCRASVDERRGVDLVTVVDEVAGARWPSSGGNARGTETARPHCERACPLSPVGCLASSAKLFVGQV
eukprot:11213732-Lingulodinium_polyedra.AAC.1